MKIAVLGSTGMAGHMVSLYLEEAGHMVYRASRSERNTLTSRTVDAADPAALRAWLEEVRPDGVVNCIGLLQRACEARPDRAVLLNAYIPHYLESLFSQERTKVIHLSTDCVFSGSKGGYAENALPDGRTMYDRSKALGELNNRKDLTLRMSIIGPDTDPGGTGLLNWFMAQKGELQGYSKTLWNGVTTLELAKAVEWALRTEVAGLYHLVPAVAMDKYSLLRLFQQTFQKEDVQISRIDGPQLDKTLVNTRTDFGFQVGSYPAQLEELKQWMQAHRELYPHYRIP